MAVKDNSAKGSFALEGLKPGPRVVIEGQLCRYVG
jgi:hypothetical protein